jgi:hypothetical protein
MKQLLSVIIFTLTLGGCTHQNADTSHRQLLDNISTNQVLLKDSIDKYGLSGCVKSFHNELNSAFKKAIDSAWNILLANDKANNFPTRRSKEKFKQALIANDFIVDSSDNRIRATKRGFNERWRADWEKDSNCVELVVTRWYKGDTYDFMISSDKFDK